MVPLALREEWREDAGMEIVWEGEGGGQGPPYNVPFLRLSFVWMYLSRVRFSFILFRFLLKGCSEALL